MFSHEYKTTEYLEARLEELTLANNQVPQWGAAVGARQEEIDQIKRQLELRYTAKTPVELTTERGKTHGDFTEQARTSYNLKQEIRRTIREPTTTGIPLTPVHLEAIDMILHKISRIVNGDPTFADHWDDIAGYAHLGKGGHNK